MLLTRHITQDSDKQAILEDKMDQEFALLVSIAIPRMLVDNEYLVFVKQQNQLMKKAPAQCAFIRLKPRDP